MAHQRGMDVTPSTPLDRIHREESFRALFRTQRAEKVFGGYLNGSGWHAGLFNREKTGNHGSVGSNSLKGFCRCGQDFSTYPWRAALGV